MNANVTKYGILVGVDGSADSDAAVRWATREAVMRGARVTLMHVFTAWIASWPVGPMHVNFTEVQQDNAKDVIDRARKTLFTTVGETTPPDVNTEVIESNIVPTLIGASKDAQMVVVGGSGMGALERVLLGSVSTALVHHAHCPVAVVHGEASEADSREPILLGIDGSPASEAATALAFDEASRRGVELVALHAWSDVGIFPILGMNWSAYESRGQEVLAERLAGWQERYPDVPVRRQLECDTPARWLLRESKRAQLVVVGSHGRGGFAGMLLGSVSTAVAQSATVPVIVVREGSTP